MSAERSAERLEYDELLSRTSKFIRLNNDIMKSMIAQSITALYKPEVILEYCLVPETHKIHKVTVHVATVIELEPSIYTTAKKINGMTFFMSVYYKLTDLDGGNQNISVDYLHSYISPDSPILDILSVKILHILPILFEQIHLDHIIYKDPMAQLNRLQSGPESTLYGIGLGDKQELFETQYKVTTIKDQFFTNGMLWTCDNGCAEACYAVGPLGDHHCHPGAGWDPALINS